MSTAQEQQAGIEWDILDRLRKALRVGGVSIGEMAKELEVSRNTVGNYLSGRTSPPPSTVKVWALRCGVPYAWLRDGSNGGTNPPGDLLERPTDQLHVIPAQRPRLLAVAS